MANRMRIYYRASSHVPLWKVMEQGGFLERHGVAMDFGSMEGMRGKAMQGLRAGEIDIVSGNHHNLYVRRARHGEPFVHLAQPNNQWRENCLVAGDGVHGLQDLKGKRVVMDDFDGHTGLNVWLYLRLHGLEEGRDVELVTGEKDARERVRSVMSGQCDATFVRAVDRLRARAMGATLIDLPSMDMIEGVTLTTTTTYVQGHAEEIRSLIRAPGGRRPFLQDPSGRDPEDHQDPLRGQVRVRRRACGLLRGPDPYPGAQTLPHPRRRP